MPIYEYECRSCRSRFETLVRSTEKSDCPRCGSEDIDRQLSTFAVATRATSSPKDLSPGACGSCGDPRGPGSCAIN